MTLPPICLHLVIGEEAADRLRDPVVEQNRGGYLLGATTPDIRLLSGAPRQETHFFDLEAEYSESSVTQFFQVHPHLDSKAGLSPGTRAFIAGYLSHLVTDEVWILEIYRPYFGRSSSFGSDPVANILDRVLQFELDRRERLDKERMTALGQEVEQWQAEVQIDFIAADSLSRWREFVVRNTRLEPDWERFRRFAERALLPPGGEAREQLGSLLDSIPDLVTRVLAHVPEEAIQVFRDKSAAASASLAREYLS